ncbi:MAG: MotA/TolQ/ExbB proton channel family protein [Burkholderiaceae bacterium]|jgi:biopolymer transport protein ExbB
MNPPSPTLGLMHFWEAGDAVTHSVAWLLLAMSIISWYLILSKAWSAWRLRSGARAALEGFWNAADAEAALRALGAADTERAFVPLAERAFQAARTEPRGVLAASVDRSELITRTLRQEINRTSARLEAGLTLLASIGSTAPFIGLFGTVWGIYHALLAIAASGQVQIDRIAGPVGEALVMTAAGLAVAIPAVLAYNGFTRVNRVALAELDGFAHDLLALLTTGTRVAGESPQDPLGSGAQSQLAPTQRVGS